MDPSDMLLSLQCSLSLSLVLIRRERKLSRRFTMQENQAQELSKDWSPPEGGCLIWTLLPSGLCNGRRPVCH